ncbi:MAG TPA: NAD-dependent dehydratase [Parvularcula sp.]|nr:NAD-dependent dehydratase [Parvularcula sp.]
MSLSLVTGGAGFVGGRLVRALQARGERVRVIDLNPVADVEAVMASIEDVSAVRAAMAGADVVYHLAGDAQLWARDAGRFERINHQGTRAILTAAVEAGVRRFVHCSSLTTLVGRSAPIGPSTADETTEISPQEAFSGYPRSKALAEQAVREAVARGLDAVIAIPTEPLGAGDVSLTPPSRMIVDLANGRMPATIDCLLNFVAVDSLADGLIAAATRGKRGQRYVLGGENVSMARLLAEIERQTGKTMPRATLPYAVALVAGAIDTGVVARITGNRPAAPLTGVRLAGRRVSFSSLKAEIELGWKSAPFEQALGDALRWFRGEGLIAF